ncbi:Prefoldin subunit 6 [Malassezia furfur]|uniref:Prefoldin subunit 6 n=1 Tax=Malassezia furfur TaxID=55194 RepID=A0ABY8EW73_MALFU|nr:YKE2 [Malassezia furfur]WFD49022.1 Prefoldin subunit 6 [Malassezia furfur]
MTPTDALKPAIAKFQEAQSQFETVVDLQQQLLSQLSENQQVQQEFARSGPDTRVYKRAGPVLLPQDFQEASDNVTKRIEFIQTELQRVEKQIATLSANRDAIKEEILAAQQRAPASSRG